MPRLRVAGLLAIVVLTALGAVSLALAQQGDSIESAGVVYAADGELPAIDGPLHSPRKGNDGDVGSQAVLGLDERVRIEDTTEYPASAIAWLGLYDQWGDLSSTCTGTFIGPDVLLTAAHCLYDDTEGWTTDIVVVPGKDGLYEPFGYEFATHWWVPSGWIGTGGASTFEWGLVRLSSRTLGDTAGWMRLAQLTDETLSAGDFTPAIIGYPGDAVPLDTMWGSLKDAFVHIDEFSLYHNIDTSSGQSGAAVFAANVESPYLGDIVGIHWGSWTLDGVTVNEATRVDRYVIEDLLSGCSEMGCAIAYYIEEAPETPTVTPTTIVPTATATPSPPPVMTVTPTATIPPQVVLPTDGYRVFAPMVARDATSGATPSPTATPTTTPITPVPTATPTPTSTPMTPVPTTTATASPSPTATPTPSPPPGGGITLDTIDGYAFLLADDGQYLGIVSSNRFMADSICNQFGTYGSEFSSTSVRNDFSNYGSQFASQSAYNKFTSTPPAIVYLGQIVGYLTKNQFLPGALDPDILFAYYDCVY